jgi:hypothetical protein
MVNCPNDFPSAQGYKTLSREMAQEAKEKHRSRSGGVQNPNSTAEPPDSDLDSSEEDNIKYVPPPDEPHLYPQLLASSVVPGGPILPCEPMIDSGCITVMIKPEYADALRLKRYPLKQPVVFWGFKENRGRVVVNEGVVFRLFSPDRSWRSRKVYAKVTPELFTNVIFGLPALKCDRIVIDHHKRTAKSGRTGSDLMSFRYQDPIQAPIEHGPPETKSKRKHSRQAKVKTDIPTPKSSVWKSIQGKARDPTVGAIAQMVRAHLQNDHRASHVIAAAVRQRIEELQGAEILQQMHQETMAKYKDRFLTEIPLPTQRPDTEYHRI